MTDSRFNFWVPVDIEKSGNGNDRVMKIKGIASTGDKDSEGEILEPIGFDLTRFKKSGFFNWNHQAKGSKDGAKAIIGEPTEAKILPGQGLYVEGFLYKGHPLAESVYNLAETLETNGSKRKLGFSIEGRALERDPMNPKRITKALITGIAVTHVPVNTNTYLDLVKGEQKDDFVEYESEEVLHKSEGKYIYEFEAGKKCYGITKSFEVEEIEKDMTAANTNMLVPESVSGKKVFLNETLKKAISMGIVDVVDIIQKAKGGVYHDTPENRKLGRVGQRYGGSSGEKVKPTSKGKHIASNPSFKHQQISSVDRYKRNGVFGLTVIERKTGKKHRILLTPEEAARTQYINFEIDGVKKNITAGAMATKKIREGYTEY